MSRGKNTNTINDEHLLQMTFDRYKQYCLSPTVHSKIKSITQLHDMTDTDKTRILTRSHVNVGLADVAHHRGDINLGQTVEETQSLVEFKAQNCTDGDVLKQCDAVLHVDRCTNGREERGHVETGRSTVPHLTIHLDGEVHLYVVHTASK